MKVVRHAGATSNILQIFIADSSSTTGAGLTGIVFNTSGLTAYYHRDGDTTATSIALVTMTVGTFTSSGFKEIDSTNMPGWYQFCPPDAAFSTGKSVGFHLKGVTNMAPLPIEVDLWAIDPQVATNAGITALPTTAVTTNASLLTSGTGTDQLSVTSGRIDAGKILGTTISTPATAGILDVNVKNMNNVAATSITTINANQGTTQPLNFTGTAGSALVKSDMVDVAGSAVSATTAQIGVNVVNWNNTVVATPATAGIPDVNVKNINNAAAATPGASGGILISGSNAGTTTLAALTVTGTMTVSDGVVVTRSSSNSDAVKLTGTGSGNGLTLVGGAAITTTAAGVGLSITGGAASTGPGGVSGAAVKVTGGAGAASTNGSAVGIVVLAGGTTTVSGNDAATFTGTGNGNGITFAHAGSGQDFNATTTPLTLAKTTNITGFNDIAATAIVSAGAITTSGGKVSGVILVDTLTTYTGNTVQTGDSYARIGAAGAGLTALGDTRIANLDAAVSTRMATYTQPTGFLAATFPSGTIANTTNITAGTITTVTNLTNAATAGDFTATMKTSIGTAVAASAVASVTGNVGGNVTGSVGSVAGNVSGSVASVVGNVGGNVTGTIGNLASGAKTDVENATWNTVLSGHLTAGSTGAALNAAGAAGDPWSTAIPGAYGAGTAGFIVGTNLDATISSRAQTSDVPSANSNADALLDRAAGIETGITPRQGLRVMLSALCGKLSGAGTATVKIRDTNDTKDRITATVDSVGDRTAVTLNVS